MAGHHLTTATSTLIEPVLDRYLAALTVQLHGPRRARNAILTEINDGLSDTIDAHQSRGLTPTAAVTAAIDEFGDPPTVAASFAGELATVAARRTVAAFLLTGPLVGIWWLLLLDPRPWHAGPSAMPAAIPALPLVAAAIAAATGIFATTGRLMRWLPETTPARALRATIAVAALCITADLVSLGILAARVASTTDIPAALATIATAASLIRIAAATLAISLSHHRRTRLRSAHTGLSRQGSR